MGLMVEVKATIMNASVVIIVVVVVVVLVVVEAISIYTTPYMAVAEMVFGGVEVVRTVQGAGSGLGQ